MALVRATPQGLRLPACRAITLAAPITPSAPPRRSLPAGRRSSPYELYVYAPALALLARTARSPTHCAAATGFDAALVAGLCLWRFQPPARADPRELHAAPASGHAYRLGASLSLHSLQSRCPQHTHSASARYRFDRLFAGRAFALVARSVVGRRDCDFSVRAICL